MNMTTARTKRRHALNFELHSSAAIPNVRQETMITRLDHIQLAMPPDREDDARSFFVGILGMIEQTKPEPVVANRIL